MNLSSEHQLATERLRRILADWQKDEGLKELIVAKDRVLQRYQPVFTPAGIEQLTASDFRGFLMFRKNGHWTGLDRLGPHITSDMPALKNALLELIDKQVPVGKRLDNLLPKGKARVHKLGKAVHTPILLITRPDTYAVWNGTLEASMEELRIWPDLGSDTSIGARYEMLCDLIRSIADYLSIDIWTMDALWWRVVSPGIPEPQPKIEVEVPGGGASKIFGLQRHLQDFLLDNRENTELGKEWDLVEEGGEVEGYGYERPTDIGRIDLLAHHKSEPRWLVIELKRAQSTDATLGQVLRYMG